MWTSDFVKASLASLIRHGATAAAGYLVTQGLIQGNQTNDLIGCALFVFGIAWSWWQKRNTVGASVTK